MKAPGSSSRWACSCQNVATHCPVVLPIRAHFLQLVDFGTHLLWFSLRCTDIHPHRYCRFNLSSSSRKQPAENLVSVANFALVNNTFRELFLHLHSGSIVYWFTSHCDSPADNVCTVRNDCKDLLLSLSFLTVNLT